MANSSAHKGGRSREGKTGQLICSTHFPKLLSVLLLEHCVYDKKFVAEYQICYKIAPFIREMNLSV